MRREGARDSQPRTPRYGETDAKCTSPTWQNASVRKISQNALCARLRCAKGPAGIADVTSCRVCLSPIEPDRSCPSVPSVEPGPSRVGAANAPASPIWQALRSRGAVQSRRRGLYPDATRCVSLPTRAAVQLPNALVVAIANYSGGTFKAPPFGAARRPSLDAGRRVRT